VLAWNDATCEFNPRPVQSPPSKLNALDPDPIGPDPPSVTPEEIDAFNDETSSVAVDPDVSSNFHRALGESAATNDSYTDTVVAPAGTAGTTKSVTTTNTNAVATTATDNIDNPTARTTPSLRTAPLT
jgi:hypothetical protein